MRRPGCGAWGAPRQLTSSCAYYRPTCAGRETDASIVWHLASLFFNDPHYSQIGGQGPDGRDLTSPLSFLVLEAMHRLRIPANIAVRVHEGMDRRLLRRALELMVADGTGVSFALSAGWTPVLPERRAAPLARMRAKSAATGRPPASSTAYKM